MSIEPIRLARLCTDLRPESIGVGSARPREYIISSTGAQFPLDLISVKPLISGFHVLFRRVPVPGLTWLRTRRSLAFLL